MNKFYSKYLLIILNLLFVFFICSNSNAELIKFDPSLFNIDYERWIEPFKFYSVANTTKIAEDSISIDLGLKHGVQLGFVYDVYHENSKEPDAKICINFVETYTSSGYYIKKPKYIDNIIPGDRAIFSNLIEIKENISYQNRLEKNLEGKITLLEKDLCFIDIKKSQGIKKEQVFEVFDNNKNVIGEIEIIETVEGGDSIGIIKNKKNDFSIGYIVKKNKYNYSDWINLAENLSKETISTDDAIYAYLKAIQLGLDPKKSHLNFEALIMIPGKKYEKEGNFAKASFYWNLCKKNNELCDENHKTITDKSFAQAKQLWNNKEWLEVIINLENIPKTDESAKYLSGSYNFLGKEVEEKNHAMAIYCYEQSFKISPNNVYSIKNLINLYFKDILFDKAFYWIQKLKQSTNQEEDKNWADIKQEEIMAVKQNKPQNYSFTSSYGKEFSLYSLNGNLVLLVLWDTGDFNSKSEIDVLRTFHKNYLDKKFKILAIHKNRNSEAVKNYLNESKDKLTFDIVFADENINALFPDSNQLPQNIILDKKGKIIYQKNGYYEKEIKDIIDSFLVE